VEGRTSEPAGGANDPKGKTNRRLLPKDTNKENRGRGRSPNGLANKKNSEKNNKQRTNLGRKKKEGKNIHQK